MKIVKEINRIAVKLVGMAMVMMAMLLIGRIEVKAEEPNYLTFEAMEDGSVGLYIATRDDSHYVEYQKFNGNTWGDWTGKDTVSANPRVEITTIDVNCGEKVRFRGKNASVHFGGTEGSDGLVIGGYITKKMKVSGDITTLTNLDGKLDSLIDSEGNIIAKYDDIFKGCTGLVSADKLILPSTKLSEGCYSNMFIGCTSLTEAPELPATELAEGCYSNMFEGCTSLTTAPELPATELADRCYSYMFNGCTSLATAPELPATELAECCYSYMFNGCTSLTTAPSELPATELAERCYSNMFEGCEKLTTAPELLAETVAINSCENMFLNCKSLTDGPSKLPATELAEADSCYFSMFKGCENLTKAPKLPATVLANYCYANMFNGCINLTDVSSELPARELADSCYSSMFEDCINLTKAPKLPATELANYCYANMFKGCENLTKAPSKLPATELKKNCYNKMFMGCKKLKQAPDLLNLRMKDDDVPPPGPCYCQQMFSGCVALETVPKITVESLAMGCFSGMFEGCKELKDIHRFTIPNLTLKPECFYGMFSGCTKLELSKDRSEDFKIQWEFRAINDDDFNSAVSDMFYGCDTDLEEDEDYGYIPEPGHTYYLKSFIFNITVEESENGTVTADKSSASVGDKVELTVSPDEGYKFDSWVVSEDYLEISDDNTFTMPFGNVTIKAIFKPIEYDEFEIRITNDGHGTASATKETAREGEEVLLSAYPDEGYVFDEWESDDVTITDDKFIMPGKDVTIKATFKRVESDQKPVKQDKKKQKKQEKKETVYADLDTFKSELPAGTVLTMDIDNFKQYRDMKVHSLDKTTVANQTLIADFFASQMKKKAKILHTYGIYTRSEIPLVESGAKKVLSWNNLSIKTPGTIYAACYNTKDGAYLLSGTVNEKGTAVFFDFRLHEATNVSIFTLE